MRRLLPRAALAALLLPTLAIAGPASPAPPLRAWVFVGGKMAVSAGIPKGHDAPATLTCRLGRSMVAANLLAQGAHGKMSLSLDGHVYDMQSVQAKEEGRGIYRMTGQLALTPKLARDLTLAHSKAGFLLDGKAFRYGRPVDALAKLASRCTALTQQKPGD